MSFFEGLKAKLALTNQGKESTIAEQGLLVSDNLLQEDNIILADGSVVNIYLGEVGIKDVLRFFKERMPWVRFNIEGELLDLKTEVELLQAKYMVFLQLSSLLAEASIIFNGVCFQEDVFRRELNVEEVWKVDGKTIH